VSAGAVRARGEEDEASILEETGLALDVAPAGRSPRPPVELTLVPPRASGADANGGRRVGRYSGAGEVIKDATDRLLAAVGLVLVSPLLLAIAVAVRLDSPGPALFRQTRVGRNRRPFTFYKFRGMFRDAQRRFPKLYDYSYSAAEVQDLRFHPEEDPRVTRVGKFLRRTSLDELPNLINVVLGDMSLVGPRPEIPELIPYYGAAADAALSVKPGVTSLAKLVGRDHFTFSETLAVDLEYIRTRSLLRDFRILTATVILVLTGRNVGH